MLGVGSTFDRYRIEARLGRGGMGEVFLARDTKLERRVALKILRRELADGDHDAGAHAEQLLREARAAAALDHPNVVAIFDVGEVDGTPYLAMEFIEGRSLRGLVEQDVPVATRMAWLVDVARALSLAHKRGLIHRDVKPENVMVRRDGVVKVLDFGIARRTLSIEPPGVANTAGGSFGPESRLVGTPRYMAPEQILAQPIDGRVDQFAWGVLAYELLSGGRMPWPTATSLVALVAHILGREPSLLEVPGLPDGAAEVIRRALRPTPGDRFGSMDALLAALGVSDSSSSALVGLDPRSDGSIALASTALLASDTEGRQARQIDVSETVVEGASPSRPFRSRTSRRAWSRGLALLALVVGAVTGGPPLWRATHPPPVAPSPVQGSRAVTVLGFEDLANRPDTRWIGDALLEMTTSELGAGDGLRVIAAERVTQMLHDLAIKPSGDFDSDTLARIGRRLGTDLVVCGAYVSAGGKLRLDLRLQDVSTGETLATVRESGVDGDLIDIVGRAGAALRRKLNAAELSKEQTTNLRATVPASPEGLRAYSQGLVELRAYDALAAKGSFASVTATDPGFAPAHAYLAEALGQLGHAEAAGEEARRAKELSGNLPMRERLAILGRYEEAAEEWPQAIDAYQALHDAYPDDFEYSLHLAQVLTLAKRADEAIAILDALRSRPPPLGGDPRIDLAAAEARSSQGDVRTAGELARAARQKAEAIGATSIVVNALHTEGWGLVSTGDVEAGRARLEEAERLALRIGNRWEQAEIDNALAVGVTYRGDAASAVALLTQAERLYREVGNPQYADMAAVNRAYDEVLLARLDAAEADAASCMTSGVPYLTANARMQLAYVALLRADPVRARSLTSSARETFLESHDERMIGWSDAVLGTIALAEGRLDEAESSLRDSLAVRDRLGLTGFAAESRLGLARVALARGAWDEAETLARSAAEGYASMNASSDEATAQAVVAEARLGRDPRADVSAPLARGELLTQGAAFPASRIEVGMVRAMATAATRDGRAKALHAMDGLVAEATHLGLTLLAFQLRAAGSRIAVDGADAASRRAKLATLRAEASSHGLRLASLEDSGVP
jgi:serine/threonine protein kinase/TolB-like protein